jgi:guanine nucleotide-binding protein alpha-1 subunit
MLLGQAESGKSTLQKQFQLHYASKSLEKELPSWRPIVLFNIIQAVRTVIETLDNEFFNHHKRTVSAYSTLSSTSPPKSSHSVSFGVPDSQRTRWKSDLSQLRTRLLPLTAIEDSLASELCGGALIAKGGSGFVRAGWQSLVASARSRPVNQASYNYMDGAPPVSSLTMKTLAMVQDDIEDLWRHPTVKSLLKQRKLILQESAAL